MSSETEDTGAERAGALKDLVESEGWKLLARRAADEWGEVGYGRRMRLAIEQTQQGPDRVYEVARIAEEVTATKRAIDEILNWPFQELQRLKPAPKSRRPFDALRRS